MPANDFQEERIQQLEQDSKEITATVREYCVKLEHLSEKIQESGKNVADKLDSISARIDAQMEVQGGKIDKISESVIGIQDRVKHLETTEKSRAKTRATFKKIIMAAILAAAGVVGSKAVEKFVIPPAVADVGTVAKPTIGGK